VADQITGSNQSDKTKPTSGVSPWDEELDLPEEEATKSQIVGSLDESQQPNMVQNQVPFNVPEEIIEDKVGRKISAEEIKGGDTPKYFAPEEAIQDEKSVLQTEDANKNDSITNKATANDLKNQTPVISDSVPKTGDDQSLEPLKGQNSVGKSDLGKASIVNQADVATEPLQSKENGVLELISKTDEIDPFAGPLVMPETTPKKQDGKEINSNQSVSEKSSAPDLITRPPVIEKNQNNVVPDSSIAKNLDSLYQNKVENDNPKKDINEQENENIKTDNVPEAEQKKAPKKRFSLLGVAKIFKKDKQKGAEIDGKNISSDGKVDESNQSYANAGNNKDAFKKPKEFKLSPKISIGFSIVMVLVVVIYLTEIGAVSLGLENIYGAVGLEKIWGGLPKSAEQAFGMAIVKNREHMSFKYQGSIKVIADKTKDSSIVSPLLSYGKDAEMLADFNIALTEKATLAQYDYYDDYYGDYYSDDSADSSDEETDTDTSVISDDSEDEQDESSISDIESPDPTEIEDTDYSDDEDDSYTVQEPTLKQLEFDVEGKSDSESISGLFTLKPLVGVEKYINLVNSGGNIYVKSDQIKYHDSAENGKWLQYELDNLSGGNNLSELFNINLDSGFSIIGRRTGSEKISNLRCYKYKIDNLEIGNAFEQIGMSQESVNSISGNIWIGIKDHLIHKASLEIIPSISSSLTRIQIELNLFDYDIDNEIIVPSLGDVVKVGKEQSQVTDVEDKPSDSSASINNDDSDQEIASESNQRVANDAKRHQDLENIKKALNNYKAVYGRYPKSENFININTASNVIKQAIVPAYITSMPLDPKSSESWWYGYKSDGYSFTLSARFENINDKEVTKVGNLYLHYVWN